MKKRTTQTQKGKIALKRRTVMKREAHVLPQKKVAVLPALVIVISLLLLLLVVAGMYRFYAVGKAITVETPVLEIINLNLEESASVNVNVVHTWNVSLYSSYKQELYTLFFNVTPVSAGVFMYQIFVLPGQTAGGDALAQGLFSSSFSSVDVYFPDDDVVDLELDYNLGHLHLVNPHYVEPEMSTITVFKDVGDVLEKQNKALFYVELGKSAAFLFNVTSTKTPVVTARWLNGTALLSPEFMVNFTNASATVMSLNFTPVEEKPYVLVVNSTVDTKITTKKYVFAAGNIVYALAEAAVPDVVMKKIPGGFNVTFTFEQGTGTQALSLPCGEFPLTGPFVKDISVVKSYDQGVQQWKENVPSEFTALVPQKGYRIELIMSATEKSFTVFCPTNLDVPPEVILLSLKQGWNLIGIPGYEPVLLKDLQKKVPFGSSITKVYTLTSEGAVLMADQELQPGKAYWVKVG